MAGIQVDSTREALSEAIDALREWTSEIEQEANATPGERAILQTLSSLLEVIKSGLDQVAARYAPLAGGAARPFSRLSHLIHGIHGLVFTLGETARARPPSGGLVRSLQELIRPYVPDEAELLFRPGESGLEYRYVPFGEDLRSRISSASMAVDAPFEAYAATLPHHIVLLSYPSAERNNVLLHSIFIHEIAHFITDDHATVETVLRRTAEASAQSETTVSLGTEEMQQLQKVVTRWVWELAADLLAIRMIGPAYLFGIHRSILIAEAMETYTPNHPPSWLRVRLMVQLLEEEGFTGVLPPETAAHLSARAQEVRHIESRFGERVRRTKRLELDGSSDAVAFEHVERAIPYLMDEVRKLSDGHAYTKEEYARECGPLAEQLRHFMPLNEWLDVEVRPPRWQPASLAGILNAGWNFMHAHFETACAETRVSAPAERRILQQRLFAVIAKSIEWAQIQKDWKDAQGHLAPPEA